MNGVLIVPTGIGAEIGGHAGDGNPVAKLFASCCNKLITHPNVVNASDINEMPDNALYVEGSMLDRFLEGTVQLKEVRKNKILVVTNPPLNNETINAVSAARVTIGIDAEILVLNIPLTMVGTKKDGMASGDISGWKELVDQVKDLEFDALAIHTPIKIEREVMTDYYETGGINPWGGVEAKASKLIANALNKPVAHGPVESVQPDDKDLYFIFKREVDPRQAPELIANCHLHSVLKGLHKAPRIGKGISVDDIDFMVTPANCVGRPHKACLKQGIPVIAVKENKCCLNDKMPKSFIVVHNYLEAAGVVMAIKSGVSLESVRRPIAHTKVLN